MRQADTELYEHKRRNRVEPSKGRWVSGSGASLELNPSGSLG